MTSVYVEVPVQGLMIGLAEAPQEVVHDTIVQLDFHQADVDFTKRLITSLFASLTQDCTNKETKKFLKKLGEKSK